jgi:DNA-binding transcriptional MerR regulator
VRIGELAARAGTTVRTVRYYVAQGLLPPPVGAGPGAAYDYEHLLRLGVVRVLKARYLPLAEIRRRLAAMSLEEMEALVASPDQPEAVLDAVGRPLGAGASGTRQNSLVGRPAAVASANVFALPSTRRQPPRGLASSASAPANLWQRVVLAPGVELSFQPTDDPARARAIAELIEHATRHLASP